ncbi:MAG: ABC transporter substrate-binding protein [Syntrophaceae bacterium]|nr:ABC transporter substrate-binding protein [Syntrophaceae bacterium]
MFGSWDFGFGIWLRLSFCALLFSVIVPIPCFGQPPLKVGCLIPLAGRWGESGRECARGMLDASKWLNQRTGVFGMKLEILLIDDTSQPAETVAAFRKLNETDQILLLYIYSTETTLALLRHIHFYRIPALTSSLSPPFTNPAKYPYLFAVNPTPLDLSRIAMKFISERSGIKARKPKLVFVGSPDHLGQHFLDEAKQYGKSIGLDIGPDIWVSDLSPSGDAIKGLSSPLLKMSAYNPDYAYVSLSPKEISFLLQQAKEMDFRTRWICSMKGFDETLIPYDGLLGVQPVAPFGEDVPGMVGIREAHQRWHPYDSHTLSYVEGWASLLVMAEALGRSLPEQGFSRERVKLAFETLKDFVIGGLIPPVTFTAKDHRPSVESRIFIIKDGKLSRQTGFISIGR